MPLLLANLPSRAGVSARQVPVSPASCLLATSHISLMCGSSSKILKNLRHSQSLSSGEFKNHVGL